MGLLTRTGPAIEGPRLGGYAHRDFRPAAAVFARIFDRPSAGGGALAIHHRGELVVDLWVGNRDPWGGRPWTAETMAMSFSTTKGVSATVIHRLRDRGLFDYDDPVAEHWPEFGGDGRELITIRQLISHQAGLHRIRGLVEQPEELLDHRRVTRLVASQRPSPEPGRAPGYHGMTFGWLVAGLAEAVTGRGMGELVIDELARPLGVERGLQLGAAAGDRDLVARLFPEPPGYTNRPEAVRFMERVRRTRGVAEALLVDGFQDLWFEPERRILATEMPAVNGVFTARALATLYGALANGGEVDGVRLLSHQTVHELGRVQRRERDYVLGLPMRWRLGYHQAFTSSRSPAWKAFGHYGFGGSGAWADPETGLAVAFVTNRLGSGTTPIGDTRMLRIGGAALAAARSR
jgi:CubicO group peptidase (beta-lactamase class C family)